MTLQIIHCLILDAFYYFRCTIHFIIIFFYFRNIFLIIIFFRSPELVWNWWESWSSCSVNTQRKGSHQSRDGRPPQPAHPCATSYEPIWTLDVQVQHLTTFDNTWQHLTTFDNTWKHVTTTDNTWNNFTTFFTTLPKMTNMKNLTTLEITLTFFCFRLIVRTSDLLPLRGTVLEDSIPALKSEKIKTIPTKEVLEFCFPELQLSRLVSCSLILDNTQSWWLWKI